ncbi:hypothetical protein K438DRAFT_2015986 [Mycena galopus ATCC 62051]|nr:hypothetical protein K438DRAFT_2015986 [Mycena galopus ATCC 62051]
MAEVIAVFLKMAGPPTVDFLKRQTPSVVIKKWDARVEQVTKKVREAADGMPEAERMPDLDEFLIATTAYIQLQQTLTRLNKANTAGFGDYPHRRAMARELAVKGRLVTSLGLSTSTALVEKQLCKKAGHPQPCNKCFPSVLNDESVSSGVPLCRMTTEEVLHPSWD